MLRKPKAAGVPDPQRTVRIIAAMDLRIISPKLDRSREASL